MWTVTSVCLCFPDEIAA